MGAVPNLPVSLLVVLQVVTLEARSQ